MTDEKVKCGACQCPLRRSFGVHRETRGVVYTRTLVRDQFLPSCSERCAQQLRGTVTTRRAKFGLVLPDEVRR